MIKLFLITFIILLCYNVAYVTAFRRFSPHLHIRLKPSSSLVQSRQSKLLASTSNGNGWEGFFESIMANFQGLFGGSSKVSSDVKSLEEPNIQDAVMIVGATGKLGEELTKVFLTQQPKRQLVLVARNASKLYNMWTSSFNEAKNIVLRPDVDLSSESLSADVFAGVSQVVSVIGPAFSDFNKDTVSQDVDYKGNVAIIEAAKNYLKPSKSIVKSLISFAKSSRDMSNWRALNDNIMGGRSSSSWSAIDWKGEGDDFMRWQGTVVVDGGGFAGTINNKTSYDMTGFDGVALRVRGDGNRYKFRMQREDSGVLYQASFDTIKGAWMDVRIPFSSFVPLRQTKVFYNAETLYSSTAKSNAANLGIILSKFEYNGFLNPQFVSKDFALDVATIGFYSDPRPSVVMISSAGTERINRLDDQQRFKDVPIVQLNPKGILNWKYKAECHLRQSGLPYSIIRSTGLVPTPIIDRAEQEQSFVDLFQGDYVSGRITRFELAKTIVKVLNSPYGVGKTFEVRRREAPPKEIASPAPSGGDPVVPEIAKDLNTQLRRLVSDADRPLAPGLFPFPPANDPPAALSEEKTKAIINSDPRVAAAQQREIQAKQQVLEELKVV